MSSFTPYGDPVEIYSSYIVILHNKVVNTHFIFCAKNYDCYVKIV